MSKPDRTKAPIQHPIAEIKLPAPRGSFLTNGIPYHFIYNENLDLIHLIIQISVGILHEKQKHLALFSYALLKESSKDYTSTEVADLLDFYGTHYSISETLDKTSIIISAPKKNIPKILPIIFDFISNPQYREENLEIYKKIKIKDLEYNSQKTDVRNTQLMLHAMFGDKLTAGQFSTKENIQAVTIPQMQVFHRETFCAENIKLYGTGHIDAEIEDCIMQLFTQVPNGKRSAEIVDLPLPADTSPLIYEKMPNSVQSSITLCRPLFGYTDDKRTDFSILSTITGGYFGSRLMQNLREKNGYTYGISSGSVYFGNQSLFIINSDVNIKDTQAAVDACFEELERLQNEPVGDEELESVKNYIVGDMLRDVENSVSYLKKYAFWSFYSLDEKEFQNSLQHIRNIDAEKILFLSRKYFQHNKFTKVIVGEV